MGSKVASQSTSCSAESDVRLFPFRAHCPSRFPTVLNAQQVPADPWSLTLVTTPWSRQSNETDKREGGKEERAKREGGREEGRGKRREGGREGGKGRGGRREEEREEGEREREREKERGGIQKFLNTSRRERGREGEEKGRREGETFEFKFYSLQTWEDPNQWCWGCHV